MPYHARRANPFQPVSLFWFFGDGLLGEQVRAALRQLHERSAIVNFQPAQANGAIEARRVFRRCTPVAEQKRTVELLNVDPTFLEGSKAWACSRRRRAAVSGSE
jgi:hypothetical protein